MLKRLSRKYEERQWEAIAAELGVRQEEGRIHLSLSLSPAVFVLRPPSLSDG